MSALDLKKPTEPSLSGSLRLALGITLVFVVVETAGGVLSNSLALLSDAGHMFIDVLALLLALAGSYVAQRPATAQKTYGYYRAGILAAFVNGLLLAVISACIFFQAYLRFQNPSAIRADIMLPVAIAGLASNIASALVLFRKQSASLNVRGVFLHVISDALSSVGTVAAALVIIYTGWLYADPLISIIIAFIIVWSSWKLIQESIHILLIGVPSHLDLEEVENALRQVKDVKDVHDIHLWSVQHGVEALSCHILVDDTNATQSCVDRITKLLKEKYGIDHVTVQVECRCNQAGSMRI